MTDSNSSERDTNRVVFEQGMELLRKVDFPLTDADRAGLAVNDFGLGDLRNEGMVFGDLLRTDIVRFTVLILLPGQTLRVDGYVLEPGQAAVTVTREETGEQAIANALFEYEA